VPFVSPSRAAMKQLRIVTFRISGGKAPAAVSRRPPVSLDTEGTPHRGLHVRRERLGGVHRSRTSFCRPVPNPCVTIRNFLIAVSRTTLLTARGVRWWEHGLRYRRSPKPALPWKVGAVSNLVIFYL
jgi:hypothetical protein